MYLSIKEVAEITGFSYDYVARQIRLGELKAKGKRNKRIKKEWLDEWMAK